MTDTTTPAPKDAPAETMRADRRAFLRGATIAAAAVPLAASGEVLKQPTSHQAPARYQESDHVKQFYALNRR